ncbi:MAG: radical SAM protein [Candidatus Helarchaeota archaeon]
MWRIVRPDSIKVWEEKEVKNRLSRYYDIIQNKRLAKFQIAKKIPIEIDLSTSSEALWKEHEKSSLIFKRTLKKIDQNEINFNEMTTVDISYLDLKIELGKRIMSNCHFCERKCKVDRLNGKLGYCKIGDLANVSSAHLHFGEEPPLVPSGTIFFCSCVFSCKFCQNWDISTNPKAGIDVSGEKLARYANHLAREEKARNINYVTPLPNTYFIIESLKYQTQNVSQLWNSNHYCSIETMNLILDLMDFWLPDFKYGNDECAQKLSNAQNYWEVVSRNHKMVHDNDNGEMIIRHLVMPNHVECCTKPILDWIAENCPRALVNVMGQYHPAHLVPQDPILKDINRRLTRNELTEARNYANKLGLIWKPVS